MKVKEYLKKVWGELRYGESGQYTPFVYRGPITSTKKTTSTGLSGFGAIPKSYYTPKSYYSPGGYIAPPKQKSGVTVGTPVTQPPAQPPDQTPALSAALGYTYKPYQMPEYNVPQYNVSLPTINWGFEQTPAQQAQQQTQAEAIAAQEINPQLQAIQAALQQYMTQGQIQRAELNPRYTSQSLAIANIIQNTVKQEAINQAIRRGAETSGWLPSALMEAGQLETQQRGDIEAQRSQELAALAALESQQTRAAGEQETMLEGLRGKRITTALAELENQAWARSQQVKESQWQSALAGEQLRASAYGGYAQGMLGAYQTQAGVGMSNADRALQAAIAAAEQGNVQYQQQYTAQQDIYQRQLEAARTAQAGVGAYDEPMVNTKYGPIRVSDAMAMGLIPTGQYAQTTGGLTEKDKETLRELGLID